jgi:hypothetical protein
MGSIYILINKINNKAYVGQTIYNFNTRYSGNVLKNTHNVHLKNALCKYDMKNFTLVEMKCPDELLDEREILFIELLDAFDNGYNMTKGGQGANRKPLRTNEELVLHRVKNYVDKYAGGNSDLESYLITNIWESYESYVVFSLDNYNFKRFLYGAIKKYAKSYKYDINSIKQVVELYDNLATIEAKEEFLTSEEELHRSKNILKYNYNGKYLSSFYYKDIYERSKEKSIQSDKYRKGCINQLEEAVEEIGRLIGQHIRNIEKRKNFISSLIKTKGREHYNKLKKMYIELKGDLELSKRILSVEIIPKKLAKTSTVININSNTKYVNEQGKEVNLSKNKISMSDPNTYKGLILTYSDLKDKYRDKFESDFWALIKTFEEILKQTDFRDDERFILNMALDNYSVKEIIEKYNYTYKKEIGKGQILEMLTNIIPNKMKYTYINKTI